MENSKAFGEFLLSESIRINKEFEDRVKAEGRAYVVAITQGNGKCYRFTKNEVYTYDLAQKLAYEFNKQRRFNGYLHPEHIKTFE